MTKEQQINALNKRLDGEIYVLQQMLFHKGDTLSKEQLEDIKYIVSELKDAHEGKNYE